MRKLVALMVSALVLSSGVVYAKGPQGGPSQPGPQIGQKQYQGAGIGKEVSTQAKEIKQTNATKGEFGQTVRERAREKERIQEHKQIKQQQHQPKKLKPKSSNATSNATR